MQNEFYARRDEYRAEGAKYGSFHPTPGSPEYNRWRFNERVDGLEEKYEREGTGYWGRVADKFNPANDGLGTFNDALSFYPGIRLDSEAGWPFCASRGSRRGSKSGSPLRRIHPDSTYETDAEAKASLEYWRTQPTAKIIESLKPGGKDPLITKPDGRMYQGNTRTKVLEERGYDINTLPREVLPADSILEQQ